MSTIRDLIEHIDELDEEDVIVAKGEWSSETEARSVHYSENFEIPPEVVESGFEYFLEVSVVWEVLGGFRDSPQVTLEQKCERVIHYAKFDA
jgi:hypothetical protein